jgi:hypothetical protein
VSRTDAPAPIHLPRSRLAVCLALLAALLGGCSGSPAQDLTTSLQQARAAVASDQLGFQLLAEGRQTSNAAQVLSKDMADQLSKTVSSVSQVQISSAEDLGIRDDALAAVNQAASAGFHARDCLAASLPCDSAIKELNQAAIHVQSVLGKLEQMS